MSHFLQFIDFFMHLDLYLQSFVLAYGPWIYLILFFIIFCEAGLILTPFLPGDSLLFAAGSLAAVGQMNVHLLAVLLIAAAVIGGIINYTLGKWLGHKIFRCQTSLLFNPKYAQKTREFFEKYGAKTIMIARFIPIVRTYAPFIAGVGIMPYLRFMIYNLVGGILWITLLIYTSYFFGNMPAVKTHFSFVILTIILLSISPPFFIYLRNCLLRRA